MSPELYSIHPFRVLHLYTTINYYNTIEYVRAAVVLKMRAKASTTFNQIHLNIYFYLLFYIR